MTLPLLLSVPHAGWRVPPEVRSLCLLTPEEILRDSDQGAAEIYRLHDQVASLVTTEVARAIVDVNRGENDLRPDGVIKTHTCWNVPVYSQFPSSDMVEQLLARYHRPYHQRLERRYTPAVRLGVDCHTMAAEGPPASPDPGQPRPAVCLSDAHGTTLPRGWIEVLLRCFDEVFEGEVTVNRPFAGGYITRHHGAKRPWVQLELGRGGTLSEAEKRSRVLQALTRFCQSVE